MRNKLFKSQKIKTLSDQLKFITSLRIRDFLPETPQLPNTLPAKPWVKIVMFWLQNTV